MAETESPTSDDDSRSNELIPELTTARGYLVLLADTTGDPLTALRTEAALAHLDDVQPPLPPAVAATSDLRGAALHDETITALIALVVASADPAVRARSLLAMTELTTALQTPVVLSTDPVDDAGRRR